MDRDIVQIILQLTGEKQAGRGIQALSGKFSHLGKMVDVTRTKTGDLIGRFDNMKGKISHVNLSTKEMTKQFQNLNRGFMGTGDTIGGITKKVLLWTTATTIIFGFIRALKGLVSELMVLERVMARVSTTTRPDSGSIGNLKETIKAMNREVLDFAASSPAEIRDIAEVLYYLGSAGLDVESQLGGLEHISNLTVGTWGDMGEIAKTVAGIVNNFGDSIEYARTEEEKFDYVTDLIAKTFSEQQVEISEISAAFQLAGSAAGGLDIDLQELVGTIGFLNTGMLKGCYDSETEILTDKGFKYFKDLDRTELVATLNPITKELEYQKPTEYIDAPYSGEMYCLKNRYFDLKVTPNHNIYSRLGRKSCKTREYQLRTATEVFGKHQTFLRGGAIWKGESPKYFELPPVELNYGGFSKESNGVKIPIADWIEFLAWYLSEGSKSFAIDNNKRTNYKVVIYQYEGEHRDEIRELLKRLPFKFYENSKHTSFTINSKQLYVYLEQFGLSFEKYIPNFVKELSTSHLRLFLGTYNKGDGTERKNAMEITTSSHKMRDDLEEIAIKAGYSVCHGMYGDNNNTSFNKNHPIWKIYISDKNEISFNQSSNTSNDHQYKHTTYERWEKYEGGQYCVEVPNSILFIRRNGKTMWCGNSKAGTALLNAFINMGAKSEQLEYSFGITFDPNEPLNFVKVLEQLHEVIGDNAKSVQVQNLLWSIFQKRGGRAIQTILLNWDQWKQSIENLDVDKIKGSAETLEELASDDIIDKWKELGHAITGAWDALNQGWTGEKTKGGLEQMRGLFASIRFDIQYTKGQIDELEYLQKRIENGWYAHPTMRSRDLSRFEELTKQNAGDVWRRKNIATFGGVLGPIESAQVTGTKTPTQSKTPFVEPGKLKEIQDAKDAELARYELSLARLWSEEKYLEILKKQSVETEDEVERLKAMNKYVEQLLTYINGMDMPAIPKTARHQAGEIIREGNIYSDTKLAYVKDPNAWVDLVKAGPQPNIATTTPRGKMDMGIGFGDMMGVFGTRVLRDIREDFSATIADAMVLGITKGLTAAQKNQVWNSFFQQLGNSTGDIFGGGIEDWLAKGFKNKNGGVLNMGGEVISMLGGSVTGGVVSGIFGMLGQWLFPVDNPVDKNTDALEETARTIRALDDTFRGFYEKYYNVPSTFQLGATMGNIPSMAGGGKVMSDGMIYAHAGEMIGQPQQLYPHYDHSMHSSKVEIKIYPNKGTDVPTIKRTIEDVVDGSYRRGAQYKPSIGG